MAKKLYHLPLQHIKTFLAHQKSTLRSDIKNSKKLEYAKRFGKASYLLEMERFISFLKIDKNLDHALKLIKYFESEPFIQEISRLMRLQDFCEGKREHFYLVLYHLREYDFELFSSFLQQCFMHFHTSQR
jgi:hypothetical protein